MSRLASGKMKRPGGDLSATRGPEKKYGQSGAVEIGARFIRSKLSPPVAAATNMIAGETVMGEEVTPTSTLTGLVTPLALKDVYEALREQGVEKGAAFGLLGIFGMGLQTYESRQAGHSGPFSIFRKQN
jgi:hypothetical protein